MWAVLDSGELTEPNLVEGADTGSHASSLQSRSVLLATVSGADHLMWHLLSARLLVAVPLHTAQITSSDSPQRVRYVFSFPHESRALRLRHEGIRLISKIIKNLPEMKNPTISTIYPLLVTHIS